MEGATEGILYGMLGFSLWAFGTTQGWAIWTMNVAGYGLGFIWLVKAGVRESQKAEGGTEKAEGKRQKAQVYDEVHDEVYGKVDVALGGITVLLLGYCLVSAWNARGVAAPGEVQVVYRECIWWLPHSYEGTRSWQAFWSYLAIGLSFCAVRDWAIGARSEQGMPARWKRFFWFLCINGAALAVEGLIQRVDGTGKLLWVVEPRINKGASSQWGPFAYRSNAAAYLNLIWPIAVGFGWRLHRAELAREWAGERIRQTYAIPWILALFMAGAAVMTLSRGGTLVCLAQLGATAAMLWWVYRRQQRNAGLVVLVACALAAGLGIFFDFANLQARFGTVLSDRMGGRSTLYHNGLAMLRDFWVFGCGPGTFGLVYQFYFPSLEEEWAAHIHNDWMETLITFGVARSGKTPRKVVARAVQVLQKAGAPLSGIILNRIKRGRGVGYYYHNSYDYGYSAKYVEKAV